MKIVLRRKNLLEKFSFELLENRAPGGAEVRSEEPVRWFGFPPLAIVNTIIVYFISKIGENDFYCFLH